MTDVAVPDQGREVTIKHYGGNSTLTLDELKGASFKDLLANMGVVSAEQDEALGSDQFGPIVKQSMLVGRPFLLVNWEFNEGDFGPFVTMFVITPDDERYIVNDGSTGVRDQLRRLTETKGVTGGVLCRNGFRVSRYDAELPNGQVIKDAETYYIDTKLTEF